MKNPTLSQTIEKNLAKLKKKREKSIELMNELAALVKERNAQKAKVIREIKNEVEAILELDVHEYIDNPDENNPKFITYTEKKEGKNGN